VKNFNVAVAEEGDRVVFLRKIVPGGTDRSYGIHVARLAGLPKSVIIRAQEVLADMEGSASQKSIEHALPGGALRRPGRMGGRRRKDLLQIPLFSKNSLLADEIARLDIDSLSPLEAITKLYELKRMAQENKDSSP
jgi:DNA mismatch repair protein MutS